MDDLFGDVPQPERAAPPPAKPLTSEDVRQQMCDLIAQLRSSDEMPFAEAELKKHRAMFPIMAMWLDEDDGRQLVFAFEQEVERLLLAA